MALRARSSGDGSMLCPTALAVSLVGFLLSFVAYYPGAMTWDSFVMYGTGWRWPWHDWHSPYIPLLMRVSRRLVGDPSALLFLQLGLSWGGLYFCACGLRRQSPVGAALLPLLGFTPMFLVASGYLHKTPLQAAVFLFVFGSLYHSHQWRRRLPVGWTVALGLLLLLGSPVRVYGLACGLPLGMLLFCRRFRHLGACPRTRSLMAAVALAATSVAVHDLVAYQVLDARRLHKSETLCRFDLAAIYAATGVDPAPRMTRERYRDPARMRELYEREKGLWGIVAAYEGGFPSGYMVPKDNPDRLLTDDEAAYYRAAWLGALQDHPGAWLRHKVHAFAMALGLGVEMQGFRRASHYRSRQNVYGLEKRGGVLYRALNTYMKGVAESVLLKPWLWLIVTAGLLCLGSLIYVSSPRLREGLTPVLALLVSAGLFYPQLFLTALDNDLRFSYWAIVSCTVAVPLFLAAVSGPAPEYPQGSTPAVRP